MKRAIGYIVSTVIVILMVLSNHSLVSKLLCLSVLIIGIIVQAICYYRTKNK